MKPLKVNHEELEKEIQSGNTYIQVGKQKYVLMEVNEVYGADSYEVTDPEEEKDLFRALNGDNPILNDEEINKMLGIKK